MTTKELIYQNAKELFSTQGYSQIGMRELAKSVGIKASSIYNHYKSKEDILLDIAKELLELISVHIYPLYKKTNLTPKEFFTNISLKSNDFFETDNVNKLTKLLIPEQYNIEKLKSLLHNEFIVKPRGAYTYYFKNLMDKGLMEKTDPKLAAKMYHSFFIYHFYEKFLSENPNNFLTSDVELFKNHINLFMDYFKIK